MIEFRKGEFLGGDLSTIISYDEIEGLNFENWYNYPIYDDCYFLMLKNDGSINIFQPFNIGLEFIPDKSEIIDDNYGIFWSSERTLVFDSIEEMEKYLKCADGPYSDRDAPYSDVIYGAIHEEIQKIMMIDSIEMYRCTCEIEENSDEDLFQLFSEITNTSEVGKKSVIATMKLFLIEQYHLELKERKQISCN